MRFPHVVNSNTNIVYSPSPASLRLAYEINRKISPEDYTWDENLTPSLTEICVQAIAKNFGERQLLNELPHADRLHLLEIIPTDLPLDIVVPLIEVRLGRCHRLLDVTAVKRSKLFRTFSIECSSIIIYKCFVLLLVLTSYFNNNGF